MFDGCIFSRDFATKIDGSIAGGTLSSHLGSVRGSFPLIHTYSPQCCSMRSPDRLHDTDCKWLHVIACDCMWLHYGWATESYCQRIRMDKVWNKVWKIMKSWMECSCWVAELLRYQVLSDPKRRQDYDSRGRCQEGFIDAKVESWKINPKIPSFLHISWEISMISMSKARRYFNFHLYVYQSLMHANIVACTISFYFLCLYLLLPEVFFSVLLGADALVPYIGRLRRPKRTSQRCQVSRVSKKPKEQDGTSDTGIVFICICLILYVFQYFRF